MTDQGGNTTPALYLASVPYPLQSSNLKDERMMLQDRESARRQLAAIVAEITGQAQATLLDTQDFITDLGMRWEQVLNDLLDRAAAELSANVKDLDPFDLNVGQLLDRIPVPVTA